MCPTKAKIRSPHSYHQTPKYQRPAELVTSRRSLQYLMGKSDGWYYDTRNIYLTLENFAPTSGENRHVELTSNGDRRSASGGFDAGKLNAG